MSDKIDKAKLREKITGMRLIRHEITTIEYTYDMKHKYQKIIEQKKHVEDYIDESSIMDLAEQFAMLLMNMRKGI